MDTLATNKQVRYAYLSALRGLAALWVILVHVAMMPQPRLELPEWIDLYVRSGTMGVEMFFVVSAFSLCMTMPKYSSEVRPFLGFALRRIFRIAPLFYVLIVMTAFFNPAGFAYNWKSILANVLFVFNFIPGHGYQTSVVLAGWTIGVEMAFYMMFPFIYAKTRSIWLALTGVFISIIVAKIFAMTVGLFASDPGSYHLYSILYRLPIFMFGIVAFYTIPLLKDRQNASRIGAALLASVPVQFYAVTSNSVVLIDSYQWSGFMFGCLLVGLGLCPIKPLVNKATAWLGDISYSMYLVHSPIIVLLFPVYRELQASDMSRIVVYVVSVAITLLCVIPVAALTFTFLESPANEWGKSFASRVAGRKQKIFATV